jgi:hypothetical protein
MISDLEQTAAGDERAAGVITIPIISLWQPWAQWVILGWKTIETRIHPRFETLAGKRIGIHSAKTWDKQAIHEARLYLTDDQVRQTYESLHDFFKNDAGKIIGTVFVREHRLTEPEDSQAALIECNTPRYGLYLRDPIKLDPPIAVKGRQAIFHAAIP